ncbi:sodium-coupled monocarboxylate transporter 1-like [Hetaerina americana]|uniref:sodium-coupled monocarboxylate transporter 1-like n=1 Tax=Hetaerina americana TaxID=62018 RepID=UPI003A7F47FD
MEEDLLGLFISHKGGGTVLSNRDTPRPVWGSSLAQHYFSTLDYSLFVAMLVASVIIGIYFAFFEKGKSNTSSEYLMGGRNIGIAPVAMSLIASYISGITLLGVPGEIYVYGTQFYTICLGSVFAGLCSALFFIPVFYELQLNSSYEYLGIRFDQKVQVLGSFLFILTYLLYIPVVIYIPALALNQVSGVNVHLITPIVSLVCIFYTTLGGVKAVVWTDALQIFLMFGSLISVVVIGTITFGGFETVWQRNAETNRTEFFNLDLDPTTRHTFWGTAFGLSINFINDFSVNQMLIQRCLIMPSLKESRILITISLGGIVILTSICAYIGLQIFAAYYDCDRISTKVVSEAEQLFPHYVMEMTGSMPGLPGLFMAGVFSAALSSMSTALNSMSGVIYEDFISPFLYPKPSEERASFIMKITCAVLGIICVILVFIVENLEGVLQSAWSLEGISCGPMLAIFVLGLFFPWASSTGTLVGSITGLVIMGIICIGNQFAITNGYIQSPKKPVSLDGCAFLFNATGNASLQDTNDSMNHLYAALPPNDSYLEHVQVNNITWIFRISYTWYSLIGLIISVVVGLIVTAITGPNDLKDVHIKHLTPPIRSLFSKRCKGGKMNQKIIMSGLSSKNHATKEKSTT